METLERQSWQTDSAFSSAQGWTIGKDRLASVTLPDGSVVSYTYDWQNRLAVRTHGNETKTFLYGQGSQVIEETYNGKRSALYGWGPDGLDSRIDSNGQTLFYLKDGLGSTLAVVDDRGRMVMPYEYSAYGECLTGPDAVNPYRFEAGIGGRTDNDTGLVYFWNRWYDPAVGRWASEDPSRWSSGDTNFYEAMKNDPLGNVDINGLVVALGIYNVSGVGGAYQHAMIVKYCGSQTTDSNVQEVLEGVPQYAAGTTGALEQTLTAGLTDPFGKLLGAERGAGYPVSTWTNNNITVIAGDSAWQTILSNFQSYQNNVNYVVWGPNSNSLAGSVLRASGINYDPDLVGWGVSVPLGAQ